MVNVVKNKKSILKYALFFMLVFVILLFFIGLKKSSGQYAMNYGGRIYSTVPITVCSNPIYGASACPLCGPGYWYQVVFQPSGGSGFFVCPSFEAMKGSNPTYLAGGYLLTGGASPHALDPTNTAAVVKEDILKGNIILAWYKLLDLFS